MTSQNIQNTLDLKIACTIQTCFISEITTFFLTALFIKCYIIKIIKYLLEPLPMSSTSSMAAPANFFSSEKKYNRNVREEADNRA